MTRYLPLLASLLLATPVAATEPPPPLPVDPAEPAEVPEPEVTIIQREDRTIEEYRVNGQVRYVKVIPKVGKPYYFVDTDGDGTLDKRFDDLDNPSINQWILLRW